MKFTKKKKEIMSKFVNRAIIGLGYGIVKSRDLILNKEMGITPQDAMDSLSTWIGRELMKAMLDDKIVSVSDSDETILNALLDVIDVAEDLSVDVKDGHVTVVVQKCLICPKRIGGYELEGNTACPVGGLLIGAISFARGSDPVIAKNKLQIAEICHIEMEF